ncbi:MAG: AsmA family protein [Corallincola sp.]|nr:AsmA family protein [Corallincola sp.]
MKRIFQAIGLVVAFIVITFVAVALAFDPNYYKPQIEKLAQDLTGRKVKIGGKVGWTLWPRFGVTLPEVTIANGDGFPDEPMLSLALATVDVAVMPLFDNRAEIGDVRIDGLLLRYQTQGGRNNLASLGQAPVPQATGDGKPAKPPKALLPPVSFTVKGISLSNLVVEVQDLDAAVSRQLSIPTLTIGSIAPGHASPLQLQAQFSDADNSVELSAAGQLLIQPGFMQAELADFTLQAELLRMAASPVQLALGSSLVVDLQSSQLAVNELMVKANDTTVSGQLALEWQQQPKLRGKLQSPLLDVNGWMPAATAADTPVAADEASPTAATEPDLSWLRTVDVRLELRLDQLLVGQTRVESLLTTLVMGNGVANLAPIAAQLYGGNLSGSVLLKDAGAGQAPAYELYSALRAVDLGQLLADLTGNDTLSGKGTFEFRGTGSGLVNQSWQRSLTGRGHLDVRDGAIKGINVAQQIRDAQARLRGEPPAAAPRQTDFAALTGSFAIAKGELINPDLQLMSPLLRINGNGHVQLVGQTLDYRLGVSLVNTLKGQDGKSRDELAGITIPLLIRGDWHQPAIQLDLMAALQGRAAQEAKDRAEALLQPQRQQAEEKLKGLLERQPQP